MAQYGFFYDNTRCTGCKTCVMACKDYYDSPLDIARRKVYDIEGGQWKGEQDGAYETDSFLYHLSIGCQHCDNPACADVCPTTAMHKDPKDGIVKVDTTKCMGCSYCVMACPYNSPQIDHESGHAVKCEACWERLDTGKTPVCVSACPLRALDSGPIEELKAKYGDVRQIYPLVNPSMTQPNFIIKPSPASELPYVESGYVSNPEEV